MKMTNESGFTVMEVLLVLVIVAIVGATGAYVYAANRNASQTYKTASTTAQASPAKVTKKTDETALIKKAVLAYKDNQGPDNSSLVVGVDHQNGTFALGGVGTSSGEGDGGSQWFAQKINGTWRVLSQGMDGHCAELAQHKLTSWDVTCTKQ